MITTATTDLAHGVDNDTDLLGIYGTLKPIRDDSEALIIEPYVIHLNNRSGVVSENGRIDAQEISTWGFRGEINPSDNFLEAFQGFKFDWEAAYQTGDNGHDRHRAVAFHGALSYQFADRPWKPTLLVEYNFASGDQNPMDGDSETFVNLFPTNHGKYGYMDLFNWSNMHNLRLGAKVEPAKDWTASIDFHYFMLDEAAAGLIGPRGTIPGSGSNSDDAGQEIDLKMTWQATHSLALESGYSHFFIGRFIKQQNTLGDNGADWGYLQMNLEF